jgi:hypothetical protein
MDRGLSLSCTFSRHAHTPAITSEHKTAHDVHDRIDQLERLVTNLMEERRHGNQEAPSSMTGYRSQLGASNPDAIPGAPGRVKIETDETSYTNSGHWTSILDGVSTLCTTGSNILFPRCSLIYGMKQYHSRGKRVANGAIR